MRFLVPCSGFCVLCSSFQVPNVRTKNQNEEPRTKNPEPISLLTPPPLPRRPLDQAAPSRRARPADAAAEIPRAPASADRFHIRESHGSFADRGGKTHPGRAP